MASEHLSDASLSMCRLVNLIRRTLCSAVSQRSTLLYASIVVLSTCLNVSDSIAQETINLTVKIEDIKEIGGTMQFAVYNSSEAFLDYELVYRIDAVPMERGLNALTTKFS